MLTEKEKEEYLGQLRAFLHAHVDGVIVLMEARHKVLGNDVLLGCIEHEVLVPPRVAGGEPQRTTRIVPIFQMIDPHKPNPYVPADETLREAVASSLIALPDAA